MPISHISTEEWRGLQREAIKSKDPINWPLIQAQGEPMGPEAAAVFSSTRGSDDIAYIATLISAGRLKCRSVLVREECLNHRLVSLDRRFLMGRGENPEHKDLKLLAIAWLRSVGADRAASEVPCAYGSADAYSPTLDIAVECGDTAASRALPVLDGRLTALLVIPYGAFDGAGCYRGVIFSRPTLWPVDGRPEASKHGGYER